MRVDIKALSDSELQEQGFNNTSGGMHGFGLYTDDELSAVCITTEKQDSISGEVVLEKLFVREDKRHYGVARKLLNHTLRTMRADGYKYAVATPDNEAAERFLIKFGFEKAEGKSALYKIEL